MNKNRNSKLQITAWRIIQVSLIVLTILGIVKSVFVSLDMDESYAIAQAYRLVTGDKLIYDMWEPHQFSAFLPAVFLLPFYKITGGMEYSVIYLRIAGILLHTLLGVFLYITAKKETNKCAAFLLLILHMNFLPKWVAVPEFELMHYWSLVLIFLLLYSFEESGGVYRPILAGMAYVISGLCYPTMIFLFPVFLIGLITSKRKTGVVLFSAASVISAFFVLLLCYLFAKDRMIPYLSYILADPSHASLSGIQKIQSFLSQFAEVGVPFGISLLAAAIPTAVLSVVNAGKKKSSGEKKNVDWLIILLAISTVLLSMRALFGYVFGDENQFTMQVRYVPFAILLLLVSIRNYRVCRREFWYGILPGVLAFPAVLVLSNMGVNVAFSKLFCVVIPGVFVLYKCEKKETVSGSFDSLLCKGRKAAPMLALAAFLLCFFCCRILLIRVTGCLPVTVKANMERIENGPAKGVYVTEEPALYWNTSYKELKNFIPEDANVLYVGREQLFYACFCKRTMAPSVQGTTIYNEMYDAYYDEFPGKRPQIVVFDESLYSNPVYSQMVDGYDLKADHIKEWMDKNFDIVEEKKAGIYRVVYLESKSD